MRLLYAVVALAALFALAVIGSKVFGPLLGAGRWEARAVRADSVAAAAQKELAVARAELDSLGRVAAHRAEIIRRREQRIVTVDSIFPPPPDCFPNLSERDSLIAEQRAQIATLAQDTLVRGRALLRLQASHDELKATLAARPRPSRLHGPSVGVGAAIGLCQDGRPCAVVGVTINIGGIKP